MKDLLPPFVQATENVIQTMAMTELTAGEATEKETDRTFGCATGLIGLASDQLEGTMLLSFEEECILAIVQNMVGESHSDVNDDVVDAVGELTNMICGAAKRLHSENGIAFNMASPVTIVGEGIRLSHQAKQAVDQVAFKTAAGSFVLEISLVKSS